MSRTDQPGDTSVAITAPLAIWGVIAGSAVAALTYFSAPAWLWIGAAVWLGLILVAILSQTDPASRAFLAGTLRKSTFTQIYTALTRRALMPIWDALCDPATDGASLRALVRAALTWRLFDRALLIAVVYPIVLLVGVWLVTGQDARLGGQVVLDGPGLWVVWPDRATVLGAFVVLAAGFIGRRLPTGCRFSH